MIIAEHTIAKAHGKFETVMAASYSLTFGCCAAFLVQLNPIMPKRLLCQGVRCCIEGCELALVPAIIMVLSQLTTRSGLTFPEWQSYRVPGN